MKDLEMAAMAVMRCNHENMIVPEAGEDWVKIKCPDCKMIFAVNPKPKKYERPHS